MLTTLKVYLSDIEQFNQRTVPGPNGCINWKGSIQSNGYGRFIRIVNQRKKEYRAHRFAWLIAYGEVPDDMFVCHRCDNPICVNIEHLFLGTAKDNATDRDNKKRNRQVHSEAHYISKLNHVAVTVIKYLHSKGKTPPELARAYKVSRATIHQVLNGESWKHIPQSLR